MSIKLHKEQIRNASSYTNVSGLTKSRRIKMAKHTARTVKINVCSVLVAKAKGKRLFGSHGYE